MAKHTEGGRLRARRWFAGVFAVLDAGIVVLHAYWALGGAWGIGTGSGGVFAAGESLSTGWRLVTWGLVVLLVAAGVLVLSRAGLLRLGLPPWLTATGCWVVALVLLGVAANDFADAGGWSRFLFAPTALVLCLLAVAVAAPAGRRLSRAKRKRELGGMA
jgi:hypothetical protein